MREGGRGGDDAQALLADRLLLPRARRGRVRERRAWGQAGAAAMSCRSRKLEGRESIVEQTPDLRKVPWLNVPSVNLAR